MTHNATPKHTSHTTHISNQGIPILSEEINEIHESKDLESQTDSIHSTPSIPETEHLLPSIPSNNISKPKPLYLLTVHTTENMWDNPTVHRKFWLANRPKPDKQKGYLVKLPTTLSGKPTLLNQATYNIIVIVSGILVTTMLLKTMDPILPEEEWLRMVWFFFFGFGTLGLIALLEDPEETSEHSPIVTDPKTKKIKLYELVWKSFFNDFGFNTVAIFPSCFLWYGVDSLLNLLLPQRNSSTIPILWEWGLVIIILVIFAILLYMNKKRHAQTFMNEESDQQDMALLNKIEAEEALRKKIDVKVVSSKDISNKDTLQTS